ncbi:hypothetical protein [Endozoicomonas ascidiicola]|uniref:hypothetical protein n=1 Tax=Endozoicomonas ascidiicola TaxID=1698521 RepID=UPI0012F78C40|nr:hypothetical protein [Endozoicomonas ascidiicola]
MTKVLSTGDPSTLGSYKKMCILFSRKAQEFIQKQIDESPHGENEIVIADECQMIMLLGSMTDD